MRAAAQVGFEQLVPAGGLAALAYAELRRPGPVEAGLSLVESDANRFVDETDEPYDVVILNELLDDLPCRVFYADDGGTTHELAPYAHPGGPGWHVLLEETDAGGEQLPPGTLRSTSDESVRLLHGIVDRLPSGGMVLVHDYGFSEPFAGTGQYAEPQLALPPFVEVEYPETPGVPKSFFRVFGNEAAGAVQITNDVSFAELTELLEPTGTVITLPHGNLLTGVREWPDFFFKGDGVFLSEFINLTAEDDLAQLLAELHDRQGEYRDRYVNTFGNGRTAIFSDLIYVKA